MAKYLQFDQKTEAPFAADSATQRMRYPAWSEPVRQKIAPALAIAIAASGLFANPFTPPAAPAPFVTTTTSDVIYPRSFIYQSETQPVLPIDILTVDKFNAPWSEPVRTRTLSVALQQQPAWSNFTPAVVTPAVAPSAVTSQVIYKQRFIYQSQTKPILPPAAATSEDQWHQPWSEPVRTRKFGPHLQDVGAPDVSNPPPVLVSQWYAPWVDPTRRAGISVAQHQSLIWANFTPAATFTDVRWIYPWSEPVRIKQFNPALQDVGAPDIPLPPTVLVSQWYEPWTDPTRRTGISVALHQSLIWSNFTPATVVTAAIVVDTFTDQVVFPRSFIYQSKTQPTTTPAPATPTFFNLTQGDTGLVFQKTLIYQVNTDPIGVSAPFVYLPWSEPTRRVGFPTHLQQSLAWSNFTPAPPVTAVVVNTFTSDVIYPRSFIYQSIAYPPKFTAEVITEDKWHYPWSEPVRQKPGLAASQQQFWTGQVTPPILPPMAWYEPWVDPVKTRTLPAAVATSGQIQALQPPTILVSQWYEPWIDPVKLKPGLSVGLHQSLIWSNFTPAVAVTDIRWFEPWVDPVRVKLGLLAGLQHFYSSQIQPPAVLISQWNYAWSEPVRQKPGLQTSLQQFTSLATPPQPNFIRTINWYQPFSEPVRLKKGIRPEQQQVFALGTPVIKTQVTLTMAAFEINLDQFLAGVIVTDTVPPSPPAAIVGANVSIKEIPAITGSNVSIEET